jgi:hypothetical protein
MGGKIKVQSEIEVGTRFIITVQLKSKDKEVRSNNNEIDNEERFNLLKQDGYYNVSNNINQYFKRIRYELSPLS